MGGPRGCSWSWPEASSHRTWGGADGETTETLSPVVGAWGRQVGPAACTRPEQHVRICWKVSSVPLAVTSLRAPRI